MRSAGLLASPLPAWRFDANRINASWPAAALFAMGRFARNGLSLACNDSRLRGLHSRVYVPGLLLRLPARPFPSPFGFRLNHRFRFAPVPAASSLQPVACSWPCPDRLSTRLPLPFGTFTSLRIKAFRQFPANPPTFRLRPMPLAPHSRYLLLVTEADQRSRSATFPEACCSSNLLEPFPLCADPASPSIRFITGGTPFPQLLSFLYAVTWQENLMRLL